MAELWEAKLSRADLSGAYLSEAKLWAADLSRANLSEAKLNGANLDKAIFQPNILPNIRDIAFANNLSKMKYLDSRQALTELREGFKKAGLRKQEREITYAINHTHRVKLWNDEDNSIFNKIESILYFVFLS